MTRRPELVAFIAGLLLFSIGLALVWFPLAFIGSGLVLMLITVFSPKQKQ